MHVGKTSRTPSSNTWLLRAIRLELLLFVLSCCGQALAWRCGAQRPPWTAAPMAVKGVPLGTSGMTLFSMIETTGGFSGAGAVGAGAGGFCPLASALPAARSLILSFIATSASALAIASSVDVPRGLPSGSCGTGPAVGSEVGETTGLCGLVRVAVRSGVPHLHTPYR